ncbi:MAG: homoserine O-acetyltransferase, partial [Actinomycetales bacterium]
ARGYDANTSIARPNAPPLFDPARERGGDDAALGSISAPLTVVGIDSDRLFPTYQQQHIARLVPGSGDLHIIHSEHGHDGFLVEGEQVAAYVRTALERIPGLTG